MKTQLLTALSIVGVLGTSTAALAANTEIFQGPATNIDTATEVLLPVTDPVADPSSTSPGAVPAPSTNPAAGGATGSTPGSTDQSGVVPDQNIVVDPAVAPPVDTVPVDGATGGSGARVDPSYGDDESDDGEYEDSESPEQEHDDD